MPTVSVFHPARGENVTATLVDILPAGAQPATGVDNLWTVHRENTLEFLTLRTCMLCDDDTTPAPHRTPDGYPTCGACLLTLAADGAAYDPADSVEDWLTGWNSDAATPIYVLDLAWYADGETDPDEFDYSVFDDVSTAYAEYWAMVRDDPAARIRLYLTEAHLDPDTEDWANADGAEWLWWDENDHRPDRPVILLAEAVAS